MPDDRFLVMERVRAALSPLRSREPLPSYPDDVAETGSIASFAAQLEGIGGRAFQAPAPLAEWLAERAMRRGYCDPELIPELAAAFPAPFTLDARLDADRIDEYDFAITRAAGAIAETGTVILSDALPSRRLASLAPWVHVAVLRARDILPTVADAIRALGKDPYVVWCSGPSKTADVEGIHIQGVHGPGEQIVLVR
jgi:L-lactate dehydrogenase complex protein LldG